MFNFNGTDYKSKSVVALNLLKDGKSRMEIAKSLGITYQTVHAIMKKSGLKSAASVKKSEIVENNVKTVLTPSSVITKKSKKVIMPETAGN